MKVVVDAPVWRLAEQHYWRFSATWAIRHPVFCILPNFRSQERTADPPPEAVLKSPEHQGRERVRTSGSGCAAERKRGPNLADQAAANERHGFQQPNFREERAYMVQEIADLVDAIDFLE
jgi:hypothetical protein